MSSLNHFLKEKRIKAGYTQMDVAKHLGYSTAQFISNWERGVSSPPLAVLKKISTFYKVKFDDLYDIVLEASIETLKSDLHEKFYGSTNKRRKKLSSPSL